MSVRLLRTAKAWADRAPLCPRLPSHAGSSPVLRERMVSEAVWERTRPGTPWRGFCQVVKAEPLIRRAGALPRSYLLFRQPAACPSFRCNSRIDSSSRRGTPTLIADAAWVGSVGQWVPT
jgi:hypothetical protein